MDSLTTKPIFSIITISYNAEKFLERTIKSIESQTCKDFEYLIIDGNSKDNTLQIAKRYGTTIDTLISEPDKGIYDAMNKGLALAKGQFVWFMNAGDEIANPNIIQNIVNTIDSQTDLIYGDTFFVNNEGEIRGLRSELTPHKIFPDIHWKDLKYGMLVCHQSLIVKKNIASEYINGNFSADIDWEIKAFKRSKSSVFIKTPIAKFLEGGVSNQKLEKSLLDRFKVLQNHFGLCYTIYSHTIILFRGIAKIIKNKGKYW